MPAGTKTSAESASAEDNLDFKTICRNFEPMRGAAAGGSERKKERSGGCAAARGIMRTNKAGSRRAHGLRPGSGRCKAGTGRLRTPAAGHAHSRDQTKRFISEKSKSFSISPSAEKV